MGAMGGVGILGAAAALEGRPRLMGDTRSARFGGGGPAGAGPELMIPSYVDPCDFELVGATLGALAYF